MYNLTNFSVGTGNSDVFVVIIAFREITLICSNAKNFALYLTAENYRLNPLYRLTLTASHRTDDKATHYHKLQRDCPGNQTANKIARIAPGCTWIGELERSRGRGDHCYLDCPIDRFR